MNAKRRCANANRQLSESSVNMNRVLRSTAALMDILLLIPHLMYVLVNASRNIPEADVNIPLRSSGEMSVRKTTNARTLDNTATSTTANVNAITQLDFCLMNINLRTRMANALGPLRRACCHSIVRRNKIARKAIVDAKTCMTSS